MYPNSNKTFLTICVPIYKTKPSDLLRCLDSLEAQTDASYHVILVDDGSPDACGDICDDRAKGTDLYTVIHQQNSGTAAARNVGIRLAESEYVAFVDPDDWIEPSFVKVLHDAAAKSQADVILFDYWREYEGLSRAYQLPFLQGTLSERAKEEFLRSQFNQFRHEGVFVEYETKTCIYKIFKLEYLNVKSLLFDERALKGEDIIFSAEVCVRAENMYYSKSPLYHYRCYSDSVTNRFNPSVDFYNEMAIDSFLKIINEFNLPDQYRHELNAWISTRLYSSMRLYYFHLENNQPTKEVIRKLSLKIRTEPYASALEQVRMEDLPKSQRVFVKLLKSERFWLLKCLVRGRESIRRFTGRKLA